MAIKTFNGVAAASVKTVNGVAVASVKTWNGISGMAFTAAPVNTVAPAVSGTAQVGQTLSCTTGTWTGTPTPTYTYQWQYGTTNISGATNSTYVIDIAYGGYTIRCVVTATNSAGSASANSNNTSAVTITNTSSFSLTSASSHYASVGNPIGSGAFSIVCWVRPASFPASYPGIVMLDGVTGLVGNFEEGSFRLALARMEVCQLYTGDVFSTDTWAHIGATCNGTISAGNGKVFVNGSSQSVTQSGSGAASYGATMRIGHQTTYGAYFDGLIDEVAIWNTELSDAAMGSIYSGYSSGVSPNLLSSFGSYASAANLQGWWRAENNGNDSSGNGRTLTLNNGMGYSSTIP